jgi:hypothetical protein
LLNTDIEAIGKKPPRVIDIKGLRSTPSAYVQSLLSKPSVFDKDSKRLLETTVSASAVANVASSVTLVSQPSSVPAGVSVLSPLSPGSGEKVNGASVSSLTSSSVSTASLPDVAGSAVAVDVVSENVNWLTFPSENKTEVMKRDVDFFPPFLSFSSYLNVLSLRGTTSTFCSLK